MIDIIFDISNGVLKEISESTQEHQTDILTHHVGWNKFYPFLGVGITNFIDDETSTVSVKSAITYEFEKDKIKVNNIVVNTNGKILIDANY